MLKHDYILQLKYLLNKRPYPGVYVGQPGPGVAKLSVMGLVFFFLGSRCYEIRALTEIQQPRAEIIEWLMELEPSAQAVVDNEVTGPRRNDFYLQSHAAIQGSTQSIKSVI